MEENLVGYVLGALDPETEREVAAYLASHPEQETKLELLRKAVQPLAADQDAFEPPADLAVQTIGFVAEYIVRNEGSVAEAGSGSVADLVRTLGQKDQPAKPRLSKSVPAYPQHGSEVSPVQFSRRNAFAMAGLTAAMLMIGLTAIVSLRQLRDVHSCANNMRVINQGLNEWCEVHGGRYPQVNPKEDVRTALEKIQKDGVLPQYVSYTCPGANVPPGLDGAQVKPIDYAYMLGYRDRQDRLLGLERGENDQFPILADAPERQGLTAVPVNHRKGQNVLFAGGHVRFCTNSQVGPDGDEIYFNTAHEARAGTHRQDAVLGGANDEP